MEGYTTIKLTLDEVNRLHFELDRLLAHAGKERDTKATTQLYNILGMINGMSPVKRDG